MPLALLALTISAFAIGTTEFVIVGLVPTIAEQLAISLPSAGLLVSIYALGVAVGAPVLTALTGRFARKTVSCPDGALHRRQYSGVAGSGLQHSGHRPFADWPRARCLLLHRFHDCNQLVPKESGVSHCDYVWRLNRCAGHRRAVRNVYWATFWLARNLPRGIAVGRDCSGSQPAAGTLQYSGARSALSDQVKVLTPAPAADLCRYGSGLWRCVHCVHLPCTDDAGAGWFSPGAVSWILLGYGISVAIGNIWGGKLADKHGAVPALKFIFAALVVLLMIFQFTASIQYAALVTVLVMGIFAFGNVPGLQVYVVQKAERYTPNAVDVASGLNIAAFNIGIALGSVIGGQTVEHVGLTQTPWIGAVIVLVAFLLIGLSGRLDKPLASRLGKYQ